MSETTIPKLFRVLIIDDKVGNSPEYQEIVSSYLLYLLWINHKDYTLDVRFAATPEAGIAYWQREVFDLTLVDSDFTKNESSHIKPEDKRSFLDLDIKFTGAYLYRFLCEMQKTNGIVGDSCKVYLWTGLREERDGTNQWEKLCNLVCIKNENETIKPWIILKQNEDEHLKDDWEKNLSKNELVTLMQALEDSLKERKDIGKQSTKIREILARVITAYRTKTPEEFYDLCNGCINDLPGCIVDGYVYIKDNELCYSREKQDTNQGQVYLSPKLRDNTSLSVLFPNQDKATPKQNDKATPKQDDNSEQQPLDDKRIKELTLRESETKCIVVPDPDPDEAFSLTKPVIAAGTPLTGVSATGRDHAIQVMKEKMEALLKRAFSKVVLKTIYLDYLPDSKKELEKLHWPQLQIQSQHRARCLRSTGHPRTLWNTGKTALESLTPQMLKEYLSRISTEGYRDRIIVSLGSKYPQATEEDLKEDLESMGIVNTELSNYRKYRNSHGTFDEKQFTEDVTQVWKTLFDTVYKDLKESPPWVEINVRHYLRECVNYNIGGNEYLSPDSVDGKMPLGNGYDNLKREFSLWLKIVDNVATDRKKKLILKLPFRGDLLFFIKIILDFKLEKEMCMSCKDEQIPPYLTVCEEKRKYYKKDNYRKDNLEYGVQGINLINAFKSAVCESTGDNIIPCSPAWYGRTDAWFGDASNKTAKYQMSGEMLNASRNELLHAVLEAVKGWGLELHLGGGVVSQEDIRFLLKYIKATNNPKSSCTGGCPTCKSYKACVNGAIIKVDALPPSVDHPDKCIKCRACFRACKYDAITIDALPPTIDPDKCVGCGKCVDRCPKHLITKKVDTVPPKVDSEKCVGCGKCVKACKMAQNGQPSGLILDPSIKVQIGTWGLLDLNLKKQAWIKCDNTAPSIGSGRPAISNNCRQCSPCHVVCPHGAFNQPSGKGKPEIDVTKCVNCKQCLTQCPNNVVKLSANGVEIPFEKPQPPQSLNTKEINYRFAFWLHELCNGCGKCSRTFYCDSFLDRRGLDWQPLMDTRNCTGCGLCVQTCPQGALQLFAPEHYAVLIGEDPEILMDWHRRLTAHQIPHFVYTKSELVKVAYPKENDMYQLEIDMYQLWKQAVDNDRCPKDKKQAVKNDKCSKEKNSPVDECPVIIINDGDTATLYSSCSKQNKKPRTLETPRTLVELLKDETMQAITAEVQRRIANLREK